VRIEVDYLLAAFDKKKPSGVVVTLSEVAMMKILCDTYYQHRALKRTIKEATEAPAEEPDGVG